MKIKVKIMKIEYEIFNGREIFTLVKITLLGIV